MSDFVLRFIAGKYEGGEYPLEPDNEIVIGRGGELEIVLVEDMVSRKHATIRMRDNKILIEDLGSTNGTFVNGQRINKTTLKENDRVLIGTSIMKLVSTASGAAFKNDSNPSANATSMSGNLNEMSLSQLLTTMSQSRKGGILEVQNEDNEGKIYLRDGKLYYALLNNNDDLGPEKALFRMLAWEEGSFFLGPNSDEQFLLEIEDDTHHLIIEGTRQLDELRQIQPKLPELEDELVIPRPLSAPLSKLERDELEVFQVVMNHRFFQSILDLSPFQDLQTCRLVKQLIDTKYIESPQ